MQRFRITKTIVYLRVFLVLFTAYTFLYGVQQLHGLSRMMEVIALSVLLTTVGAGVLLAYYGTFAIRGELRRKCGCFISCDCD